MYCYRIFPELRLVRFSWDWQVTVEELVKASLDYVRAPDFDPRYKMTADLRGGGFRQAAFEQMFAAVERCAPFYRQYNFETRSVLFGPDDMSYGQGRMYQSLADGRARYPIMIEDDPSKALAVLGLDPRDPATAEVFSDVVRAS